VQITNDRLAALESNVDVLQPIGTVSQVTSKAVPAAQKTRSMASAIDLIPYGSLTGTALITFNDVATGNYDGIFESDGASFAERFVGQILSFSGDSDVLSSSATGPLTLQVGDANDNLYVLAYSPSAVLTGLGPIGAPSGAAIGEGSFAVLFDFDQSEFGFTTVGGGGGEESATIHFFKRDGTLIETVVVGTAGSTTQGFRRVGGVNDIAGISVHNDDGGGIGYDDLIHDVQGVPGPPPPPSNQDPTANAGFDQTVTCVGSSGATVDLDGSGSMDPDTDPLTYAWSWASGTASGLKPTISLAPGTHLITLTVDDGKGGTDTDTVQISIVEDTTPPVITLNGAVSVTLECGLDTYVEAGATAVDDCDGPVSVSVSGSVSDAVGEYEIMYTATDAVGNTATSTRTVTVQDTTDPELTLSVDTPTLWSPNHKMNLIGLSVTVVDACDGSPSVTAVVVSNEPDDANGNGDGKTTGDIQINGGASVSSNASPSVAFDPVNDQLELRAERAGMGSGREYTITLTAVDLSGNATFESVVVSVPHSQGKSGK